MEGLVGGEWGVSGGPCKRETYKTKCIYYE